MIGSNSFTSGWTPLTPTPPNMFGGVVGHLGHLDWAGWWGLRKVSKHLVCNGRHEARALSVKVAEDFIRSPSAKEFDEGNWNVAFKSGRGTCASQGTSGGVHICLDGASMDAQGLCENTVGDLAGYTTVVKEEVDGGQRARMVLT